MTLYIRIAFWYTTLSGNIIHFNSVKSSIDGVSRGLSRIDLAARFGNLTAEFVSSELALPHIEQQ